MKPFLSRHGGVAPAILVFLGISLVVAGGYWYYLSFSNGSSMGLADDVPETAEEGEPVQPVAEPVVDEEPEVFSIQDAVDDLEDRGVTVVTVANVDGYSDDVGFLVEYSEFVKAAVKEETVLLYCSEDEIDMLLVPCSNSFIVWRSDIKFEDGEPVQETPDLRGCGIWSIKTDDGWIVNYKVTNRGPMVARFGSVYVNDVKVNKFDVVGFGSSDNEVGSGETGTDAPVDIEVDHEAIVHVYISDSYSNLTSRQTIKIKLCICGMDVISLINLA
jgi:hypothetical protein